MSLPEDRDARNALPVWDGFIAYFPDVPAEVAKVSVLGNKQHNLGAKLHWNTHVSTDHKNKVMRHMMDDEHTPLDTDGTFHMAKAVWRACAVLQIRCWQRDGKNEHGEKIAALVQIDPSLAEIAGDPGRGGDQDYMLVATHKPHDFFKQLGVGPLNPEEK